MKLNKWRVAAFAVAILGLVAVALATGITRMTTAEALLFGLVAGNLIIGPLSFALWMNGDYE